MLNKIITNKKHTVSELRTLRMQGLAVVDTLQLAFDRQNSLYLAQKLIHDDLTKGTKEAEMANQRLLGRKDMLGIITVLLDQAKAKLKLLDDENDKIEKYPRNKKDGSSKKAKAVAPKKTETTTKKEKLTKKPKVEVKEEMEVNVAVEDIKVEVKENIEEEIPMTIPEEYLETPIPDLTKESHVVPLVVESVGVQGDGS